MMGSPVPHHDTPRNSEDTTVAELTDEFNAYASILRNEKLQIDKGMTYPDSPVALSALFCAI